MNTTHYNEGKRLINKYPEVANLARQSAINDMCQGEADTDFHRALANVFLDFQEGKISKERYEELVYGIVGPKYNEQEAYKHIHGEPSEEGEPMGIMAAHPSKGTPLADRKPDTVTSGRKLNAALKNERILGGGKVL